MLLLLRKTTIMLRIIFLGWVLFFTNVLAAQVEITGTVTDEESNEKLIGASIIVKGTAKGTITNIDGEFAITLDSLPQIFIISYGYPNIECIIREEGHYDIKIRSNSLIFSPVLVIGTIGTWQKLQEVAPNLTRIKAEDLQLDERSNIQATLNRVPGVFMHSGALNTNRITIRGIGNRNLFGTAKIKAYFDEIPLTNGVGETQLEDIDLNSIHEVSMLKGPSSSLYGAGLGGVLHLNTPTEYLEQKSLSVGSTWGSYGLAKYDTGLQWMDFNKHIQVQYNRLHSDGYRDNNEYDRQNLFFTSKFRFGKQQVSALVQHIDLKAFIPSSLNREDYENAPQKAAFTWGQVQGFEDYQRTLVGLSYGIDFSSKFKNTTSIYTSLFDSYESRPFNILNENSNALGGRTLFSWESVIKYYTRLQLQLGAELYQENYDWQTYITNEGVQGGILSDNTEQRQTQNIFTQAKLEYKKWEANIGLSYNAVQYDYTDKLGQNATDTYTFEPTFSPYFSIQYNTSKQQVYGIVSHGFSPPTLEETLTPDGAINPDIQPEKGWNFELGLRGRNQASTLTYQLSLYSMHIKDLLVARRTDFDQFVGINAGKTLHNGLEAQVAYAWRTNNNWDIQTFLNYAYADYSFKSFIDAENDYSGNALTGTAPHTLGAGWRWEYDKGFYGNINYQFVDAMPLRDDNSISSESYHLANTKLGYRFSLPKFKIKVDVFGGINNLFDMNYASMLLINAGSFGGRAPRYYYPGLPRNYYGGLRVEYLF